MAWNSEAPTDLMDKDIILLRTKLKESDDWSVTAIEVVGSTLYFCGSEEGETTRSIGPGLYSVEWGPVVYREVRQEKAKPTEEVSPKDLENDPILTLFGGGVQWEMDH